MFDSMGSILEALSPEQQIACSTPNNILLILFNMRMLEQSINVY